MCVSHSLIRTRRGEVNMKTRIYRIENPSHPREREGTTTTWFTRPTGVTRTVRHDGEANVVTWNFANDKHGKK